MSEQDIRDERLKKLDLLKEAGMEAYPARIERNTAIDDFLIRFDTLIASEETVILAGRLMAKRGQGGIIFADIFDGTGRVQAVLQKDDMADFDLLEKAIDKGDFIQVEGKAFLTKRGERSLKAKKWKMVAKSLLPIPDEWFGLKDEEKILRERYLDMLLNENVRAMIMRRARFWNAMRYFLIERAFLEVETPVIESTPGGADARPFITHHNALDIEVYLRISCGELWQKKLLIGGFPNVFEIGRIFRNEGQSREHLQDYTQMEFYQAYGDYKSGMALVREMYRYIAQETYGKQTFEIGDHTVDLAEDWTEIDFCAALKEHYGIDPVSATEEEAIAAAEKAGVLADGEKNKARAIDNLWKRIRRTIAGPAFLTGVPVFLEPLAKRNAENPETVERFQIIIAGSEMGKGFSELNDPIDQRSRFEAQQAMRDAGDDEAQRLDLEYVRAMEYGMPPAFGFGVSERLFSFLENRAAHEAQIFPLLRPKEETAEGKSKRTMSAAIVLNQSVLDAPWKELNTTAHLAASFAAREGKRLFMQDAVVTKDGQSIPLNMQHAIMIRSAEAPADMQQLMQAAREHELTVIPFTQEMIETTDDRKVAKLTKEKTSADVTYLGVLIFGDKKAVDTLTEGYPLHQ